MHHCFWRWGRCLYRLSYINFDMILNFWASSSTVTRFLTNVCALKKKQAASAFLCITGDGLSCPRHWTLCGSLMHLFEKKKQWAVQYLQLVLRQDRLVCVFGAAALIFVICQILRVYCDCWVWVSIWSKRKYKDEGCDSDAIYAGL
jgi:hypothetical protein